MKSNLRINMEIFYIILRHIFLFIYLHPLFATPEFYEENDCDILFIEVYFDVEGGGILME